MSDPSENPSNTTQSAPSSMPATKETARRVKASLLKEADAHHGDQVVWIKIPNEDRLTEELLRAFVKEQGL